jgi:hypothetical protein
MECWLTICPTQRQGGVALMNPGGKVDRTINRQHNTDHDLADVRIYVCHSPKNSGFQQNRRFALQKKSLVVPKKNEFLAPKKT